MDLASGDDRHVLPERDMALNVCRRLLGLGIVPCRVVVRFSVYDDVVVMGGSLPGTDARRCTFAKAIRIQRLGRKVNIPFDRFKLIGFGDDGILPDSFQNLFIFALCYRFPFRNQLFRARQFRRIHLLADDVPGGDGLAAAFAFRKGRGRNAHPLIRPDEIPLDALAKLVHTAEVQLCSWVTLFGCPVEPFSRFRIVLRRVFPG
jgi:hypothetical protein